MAFLCSDLFRNTSWTSFVIFTLFNYILIYLFIYDTTFQSYNHDSVLVVFFPPQIFISNVTVTPVFVYYFHFSSKSSSLPLRLLLLYSVFFQIFFKRDHISVVSLRLFFWSLPAFLYVLKVNLKWIWIETLKNLLFLCWEVPLWGSSRSWW